MLGAPESFLFRCCNQCAVAYDAGGGVGVIGVNSEYQQFGRHCAAVNALAASADLEGFTLAPTRVRACDLLNAARRARTPARSRKVSSAASFQGLRGLLLLLLEDKQPWMAAQIPNPAPIAAPPAA